MPFAESYMISGITTAAQTATLPAAININCGFLPTRVELINTTRYGTTTTPQNIQTVFWNSMTPNSTYLTYNLTTTASLAAGVATTNAISLYDGRQSVALGPQILGSTIIAATSVCTTLAPHGLQTGDIVLMTNNTVMKQIGGLYFSITVTGASTFTIPIDLSGFPANETTYIIRKVAVGPLYYPQAITIAGITAANPMVVSTTFAHRLTVGQKVRLSVPSAYDMTQANNIQGVITAVGSATTFTLGGVDSSAFTAFAYPDTTAAAFMAQTFPAVIPVGSGPSQVLTPPYWYEDKLDDAETNVQFQGFTIGTTLLRTSTASVIGVTAGDVLAWTAWRGDI